MQRYTVDHQAGKLGRDAVLLDENGRRVVGLAGPRAITDDQGRSVLFLSQDYKGLIRGSIVSGVVGGVLDGILGSADSMHYSPNAGPGVQTVSRAKVPMRGIPVRHSPVATVSRERTNHGEPTAYSVTMHEELGPVAFAQRVDAPALASYENGYADRREGVFDLLHEDGRPLLRHWATIDKKLMLHTSTFDVEDAEFPLPEAVMLCLARWHAWRF